MTFCGKLVDFGRDESGAISVDWVVITAAIMGISLAVLNTMGGATHDYAEAIETTMDSKGIATY